MSVFGRKKTAEQATSAKHASYLMLTQGHVDDMVQALVKHAKDGDKAVASSIREALIDVGRHSPNLVLSSIHEYLRNPSVDRAHRVVLLKTMNQVIDLRLEQVDAHLSEGLIALLLSEMLGKGDVIPEWHMAASGNLVSLGQRFPDPVLDGLLERFAPGAKPPYFVVKTLGSLLVTHPLPTAHKLKVILARLLPVLSSINKEAMQWVVATAIGQFCAAAMDYVANRGEDAVVSTASMASDVFPAFEILFGKWTKARDRKVVLAALQAVGYMMALLPKAQYEQLVPKVVPVVLQLWRTSKESLGEGLPATLGMFQIVHKAQREEAYALQPLLPQMLQVINGMVCTPYPSDDSMAIKNHNELLRCIEYMARAYVDTVIGYLLQRLDPSKKENTINLRIGTLEVFKHLITRMADSLSERKSLFVAGLKPLLKTETSNTVKKYMSLVIIAMAQHDYLSLEGGEEIIEWTVLQTATPDSVVEAWTAAAKKDDAVSPGDVRQACEDLLLLAASTIPGMEGVLWPFLMEQIVPAAYAGALPVVCRCLGHLATMMRASNDPRYQLDWKRLVNLPSPQALVARLLAASGQPHRKNGQAGALYLRCLMAMGPLLAPAATPMWDSALPRLVEYCEDRSKFVQETWEDLVLRLLSETVRLMNDPQWVRLLGEAYAAQLKEYDNDPELKRLCMKQLGLVLQKADDKRLIRDALGTLFDNTNFKALAEREGCAQAYGYCSTTHLDITVDILTGRINETPPEPQKKGLFGGLFSGGPVVDQARRNTVFLCFGYVAAYAPVELIPSRAEVTILTPLKPIWKTATKLDTKLAVTKTIDLVGKALHPSRLTSPYVLPSRDELVELLLDYMCPVKKDKSGKSGGVDKEAAKGVTHELRAQGLVAIATLALLPPRMPAALQSTVLDRTRHFLDLKVGSADDGGKKKKKETSETSVDPASAEAAQRKALKEIFAKFGVMYAALMFMNTTGEAMTVLMRAVEDYTNSPDPDHRERSVRLMLYLLGKFLEYKGTSEGRELPTEPWGRLEGLGHWIGLMVPRLCDPLLAVRRAAVECVEQFLFVNHVLHVLQDKPGTELAAIEHPDALLPMFDIRDKIETQVLNEQFQLVHDVAQVLCAVVPGDDLADLLISSLPGLADPELNASAGVCVYLNAITLQRGAELGAAIPGLVNGLLKALTSIKHPKTFNGTVHAVKNLATHHLGAVVEEILRQPGLPFADHIVKTLQGIAKDPNLITQLLALVCDAMNNSVLYKDQGKSRVAQHKPLAATAALGAILGEPAAADVFRQRFAPVMGTLLMRAGTSVGQTYVSPDKDVKGVGGVSPGPALVVAALKAAATLGELDQMTEQLDRHEGWALLVDPDSFAQGVQLAARGIFAQLGGIKNGLYAFLATFLQGNYEGQRVAAAAVLAEMVAHCAPTETELLDGLLNTLLGALTDSTLRIQCIRGLSNVAAAGTEVVNRYSQTVLDALLSAVDSPEEAVSLEAMTGLAKVFDLVDEARVAPILVNLCNRTRPSMEAESPAMRAAAFQLFGSLWHFGQKGAKDIFYQQIHSNLPLMLLHVNDDSDEVRQAAKRALRCLGPLMRSAEIDELFQGSNLDPGRSLRYSMFLDELCKLMVQAYPDRVNYIAMQAVGAFKKPQPWMRANAVLLVGFLLGNLPKDLRTKSNLNPGMVAAALISLLQDKSANVRKATAETMALLWSY